MVYAVGDPETVSMDLVAHTAGSPRTAASCRAMIDTGSAGLAGDVRVTPFGRPAS